MAYMNPLSSVVIGLGQIGMEYDYDVADDSRVLTHSTAFYYHPNYKLEAGVDPSSEQRMRFENKFNCPAYSSIKEALHKHSPAVISIGVPTEQHFSVFKEVFSLTTPKAVLCEKPLADSFTDAHSMLKLTEQKGCTLLVNYMRRCEPGVLKLREMIREGKFGEIYKGTVWYSKGFLNNASHFVNLLEFLFGEAGETKILSRGRVWKDKDPEPDVKVNFSLAEIYFFAGKEECFSTIDMELIGTKGKILYKNGGNDIYYHSIMPNPIFPGYQILSQDKKVIPNNLALYQWYVVDNLVKHLFDSLPLNCAGTHALQTLKTVEKVIKQWREFDD